jgi:hypothetical protein
MSSIFDVRIRGIMPINGSFTLDEAVRNLRELQFNPESQSYELNITNVGLDSLRELSDLPYETVLTEAEGRLVLSTGLEHSGWLPGESYGDRTKISRISHHTHPSDDPAVPTPSFSDVWASEDCTQDSLTLSHTGGIIVYRKPIPARDGIYPGYTKDLTANFGRREGFSFLPSIRGLRYFHSLSDAEQIGLQRKFAEEHEVIVREASWEDRRNALEVLTSTFGKFATNKTRRSQNE